MDKGEKIPGQKPPHGGSFKYHPETDELECVEEATKEAPAVTPSESEDN